MTWTTPPASWTGTPTAAQLQQYVSDNVEHLAKAPLLHVNDTNSNSTTSLTGTSYTKLNDAEITSFTQEANVAYLVIGSWTSIRPTTASLSQSFFRLSHGGTAINYSYGSVESYAVSQYANAGSVMGFIAATASPPATTYLRLEGRRATGATTHEVLRARLTVIPLNLNDADPLGSPNTWVQPTKWDTTDPDNVAGSDLDTMVTGNLRALHDTERFDAANGSATTVALPANTATTIATLSSYTFDQHEEYMLLGNFYVRNDSPTYNTQVESWIEVGGDRIEMSTNWYRFEKTTTNYQANSMLLAIIGGIDGSADITLRAKTASSSQTATCAYPNLAVVRKGLVTP